MDIGIWLGRIDSIPGSDRFKNVNAVGAINCQKNEFRTDVQHIDVINIHYRF